MTKHNTTTIFKMLNQNQELLNTYDLARFGFEEARGLCLWNIRMISEAQKIIWLFFMWLWTHILQCYLYCERSDLMISFLQSSLHDNKISQHVHNNQPYGIVAKLNCIWWWWRIESNLIRFANPETIGADSTVWINISIPLNGGIYSIVPGLF